MVSEVKEIEKEFGIEILQSDKGSFVVRIDKEDIPKLTQEIWIEIYNKISNL